jgi:hypothetical protein
MSAEDHSDHDDHHHSGVTQDEPLNMAAIALRELLIDKRVVSAHEIQTKIEEWEQRMPADGARVVARAWLDPEFKERLLSDAQAALKEMGLAHTSAPRLVVLENTSRLHHLVTCTLCSCYPRQLLGFPPSWYKSLEYRSKSVRDPRGLLREFGTIIPDGVTVAVVDSTADCRYLVLPLPPVGYDSRSADELAGLVTRDSMIGVRDVQRPQAWGNGVH